MYIYTFLHTLSRTHARCKLPSSVPERVCILFVRAVLQTRPRECRGDASRVAGGATGGEVRVLGNLDTFNHIKNSLG